MSSLTLELNKHHGFKIEKNNFNAIILLGVQGSNTNASK